MIFDRLVEGEKRNEKDRDRIEKEDRYEWCVVLSVKRRGRGGAKRREEARATPFRTRRRWTRRPTYFGEFYTCHTRVSLLLFMLICACVQTVNFIGRGVIH